jgi:hypothetical protein
MHKGNTLESRRRALEMRVGAMLPPDARDKTSERRACNIMVAALEEGTNVEPIAELTGYDVGVVEEVAIRMRASGLWTETGTDYGSWSRKGSYETKQESLDFLMDLFVATGMLLRTRLKRSGHYVYQSLVWEGMKPM